MSVVAGGWVLKSQWVLFSETAVRNAGLVVKNVILWQRAAVYVSHSSFYSQRVSVLEGLIHVPLSARCRGHRVDRRRVNQAGWVLVTVRLGVNAVEVLRNTDASSVKEILGQEVALCSWGRKTESVTQNWVKVLKLITRMTPSQAFTKFCLRIFRFFCRGG